MEILQSTHGKPLVSLDYNLYGKEKTYLNGNFAYRCQVKSCPARGSLTADFTSFEKMISYTIIYQMQQKLKS